VKRHPLAGQAIVRASLTNNTYLINGTVTAGGLNGPGVAGVAVTLAGDNGVSRSSTTSADGFFLFTNLPSGTYSITPSQPGCAFCPSSTTATISTSSITANFVSGSSTFQILSIKVIKNDVVLTFQSTSCNSYDLQSKNAISDPVWATALPNVPGTGGNVTVTNVGGAGSTQRFYRILMKP
jgi:hypothetical protein